MRKVSFLNLVKSVNRAGEVLQCMKITDQWLDLTLMYLGRKQPNFPIEFKTRRGQKIMMNSFHDLITVWVIFCRQEYRIPKGTKVVVDAGANIGTFSIYAAGEDVDKIYAIEPFPETFSQLEDNIKNNNLQTKVELNAVALADKTGSRNMDLSDGPSQSRGLLQENDEAGLNVETLTLADFLTKINQPAVDMLKIDIEGGEHQVFRSSSPDVLQKFKHIAMEYHPNEPKDELFKKIQSSNFKLVHDYVISQASGVAYFERL